MSCPICGDDCRCAEARAYVSRSVTLTDVDDYDTSEEQFASSLAGREPQQEENDQELASGSLASARERYARMLPDVAVEERPPDFLLTTRPVGEDESWRQAVSSRIQSYKARRRRSLGDGSLSFNFESTAGNHVFLRPEVEPDPELADVEPEPEPAPAYYPNPCSTAPALEPRYEAAGHHMEQTELPSQEAVSSPEPPPALPETAKLILFPKPPVMQQAPADQLADPVFDVPRIVEAPEAIEPVMVPLADITLQPDSNDQACFAYIEPILDLPVPVAPVSRRLWGEMVDSLLVALATTIFAVVAARLGGGYILVDERSLLELLLLVPAVFWAVYKYLFLVYGGVTPGMKIAHLRLLDFEGTEPARPPRRHRALAMLVSAFPLGLGLLWSFVDPEALCWHDRISRTYPAPR